jgi:dihydropteroate synthase type 2
VSAEEERARLAPVLSELVAAGIPVSVDSHLPETQLFALEHGAAYLNDIHGFADPGMYDTLARADCRLVVMHAVQKAGHATRVETDADVVLAGIEDFFDARLRVLRDAGVPPGRLVIDPGLGYFLGSTPEPSVAALGRIRDLKERFGLPVLVSPSRKSFLRALTGRALADIGPGTLAAELYAASQGVDYIRTHDVAALRDALTVVRALAGSDQRGSRGRNTLIAPGSRLAQA